MPIVIAILRLVAIIFDIFLIASTIGWVCEKPQNIQRRRASAIIATSLIINLLFATSIL